jgi:hypothetical protein
LQQCIPGCLDLSQKLRWIVFACDVQVVWLDARADLDCPVSDADYPSLRGPGWDFQHTSVPPIAFAELFYHFDVLLLSSGATSTELFDD